MLTLSVIQRVLKVMKVLTQKNIKITFLVKLQAYKLACVDDKFTKPIVVLRGTNAAYDFIKAIFKEYQYCKKVIKNTLTKT